MRPFKMFFGIAIAVILFMFMAKVVFTAFVIAAVMSIIYAVFRRIKDFITYDRYGEPYMKAHRYRPQMQESYSRNRVEPLFHENAQNQQRTMNNVRYIKTI